MIGFLVDKVVDAVTDKLKNDNREALLGDAEFVKKQWDDFSAIVDSALSEISDKVTKLQAEFADLQSNFQTLSAHKRADTLALEADYRELKSDYETLKARVDNWSSYLENKNDQPVVKRGRGRPRKVRV